MDKNKVCVGIDFGTTNSCLSIWNGTDTILLKDNELSNTIPTVIELKNDKKIVGHDAYKRKEIFELNDVESDVIYEIKRFVGKKYSHIMEEEMECLGYTLTGDENDNIIINSKYRPEEIVTHIFMSFFAIVSNYLGTENANAIISVPAKYNDLQRNVISNCAELAGFNVLRLINEPTAGAICYGIQHPHNEKLIVVFDLGGGTLDISLLKIYDTNYEVVGVSGNSLLGGTNFDKKIMEYCLEEFLKVNKFLNFDEKKTILNNLTNENLQKLKYLSEKAKISLSDNDKTKIVIPNFYNDLKLDVFLSKAILMELFKDLISLMLKPMKELLNICEITKEDIDEIIMIGGMTKMPIVLNSVELFFGKELNCSVDPDTVVSVGASIFGYQLLNQENLENSMLLIDRTSLSIGIEKEGGIMDILIPRGAIIPTKGTQRYTTNMDNMEEITIKIYEGERSSVSDNFLIGHFVLSGIYPEKRGLPEIKVEIRVDTNGIIKIKAEDMKNTMNKKTIQISKNNQSLPQNELDIIIENAKKMDAIDRTDRTKKMSYLKLLENSHKIIDNLTNDQLTMDNDKKQEVLKNISELNEWLLSKNYADIEIDKYKELLKFFQHNYEIFLIHNEVVKNVDGLEEPIKGVKIYDGDTNADKYEPQINHLKTILQEYGTHKHFIENLSDKPFYDNDKNKIISELQNHCLNTITFIENAMIEIITKTNTDETIQQYCDKTFELDTVYKNCFLQYRECFDLLFKLEKLLEQKENEILENSEILYPTNIDEETNLLQNIVCNEKNENDERLQLILEYYAVVYKMKNSYETFDEEIVLKMINIINLL